MKQKISFIFALLLLFSAGRVSAETLILKDGRKIQGRIIAEEKYRIKIDVGGIPYTYYRDQIEKIEGLQPKPGAPIPLDTLVDKSLKGLDAIPQAKQDLIMRYLSVNGTRTSIGAIFRQLMTDLPADQKEVFRSIFNADEVMLRLLPVYDKYYTEGELQELITFYASPVGQKVVEATPQIMQEAMKVTTTYFKERVPGQTKK